MDSSPIKEINTLQLRWSSFLKKIEDRFYETIETSKRELIYMAKSDPNKEEAILLAWRAIKSQLTELIGKISNTWGQQVSPEMESYGFRGPGYDWSVECDKGCELEEKLYFLLEKEEIILLGEISILIYEFFMSNLNFNFPCSQCGANIEVSKNRFRSHYLVCQFCQSTNTYTPPTELIKVEHFSLNSMASYNAIHEWEEMVSITDAYTKQKKEERSISFKEVERISMVFYEKYFFYRIKIIPEYENKLELDFENIKKRIASIKRE